MEIKKSDNLDYLNVLNALNTIPFSVGRILLCDFLKGKMNNKSVIKHDLDEAPYFGSLRKLDRDVVFEMIDHLIANRLIDVSGLEMNKFIKVLSINGVGKNELKNPVLNKRKISNGFIEPKTKVDENDLVMFEKYNGFLDGYNSLQKKVIISEGKKVLCIAGAGSGKTTVLTKRIEFLNKYKSVDSNKILAITFTRKAKEEMQKRLSELNVDVKIETFNSFCEKILKKYSSLIYNRPTRIAGYQDKIFALISATQSLGIDLNSAIDKYFSKNQKMNKTQNQLQNVFMADCFAVLDYFKLKGFKDFTSTFDGEDYSNAKLVYDIVKFLREHMEIQGLRTYSDQINDAVKFLKKNKEYIQKFDHVLVDEFQDVNALQIELIDLLNGAAVGSTLSDTDVLSENFRKAGNSLFCVGDPRQSIFGWRGSDVNYILDFAMKYEGAEVIGLKKNYRSNNHIVDLMNYSISSMKMDGLTSSFENEKHLKLCTFDSYEEECDFVVRKILTMNISRDDVFVIARTNKQLNDLAKMMESKGIKYILKTDDFPSADIKKDCVTLSTIHSIKGLEAELVFVVGCNNFNFPCKSSEHPIMEIVKMYEYDKEEEERRLFYVAISRAKNMLYLTYSKKPTYFINDKMKQMMDEIKF